MKRKAQIGVEFFLVLSVIAAFIVLLYATTNQQVDKTRALNDAVVSKNSVDTLAQAIDFVYLSGDGSIISKEIIVSPNSNCFYHSLSTDDPGQGTNAQNPNKIYCTISAEFLQQLTGGKEQVYSATLATPEDKLDLAGCSPLSNTWVKTTVTNSQSRITVSCETI